MILAQKWTVSKDYSCDHLPSHKNEENTGQRKDSLFNKFAGKVDIRLYQSEARVLVLNKDPLNTASATLT